MKLKNLWKIISKFTDDNAPTIFAVIGVTGVIATTVLAVDATIKAKNIVDEEDEELSKKEIVEKTWKNYIPVAVSASVTIGAILMSNHINKQRLLALTAVCTMNADQLKKYREKVKELMGEKTDQKVMDGIAKDKVSQIDSREYKALGPKNGEFLCIDSLTGQAFWSDSGRIDKIVAQANKELLNNQWLSVNDFLWMFDGLRQSRLGDKSGWSIEKGYIEVSYTTCLTADNVPCLYINYNTMPSEIPWI